MNEDSNLSPAAIEPGSAGAKLRDDRYKQLLTIFK